ncbi:MAG: glycine C-acetyltransferase [Patescibacteria group bacterium]|nr:glycine C-acetyltransferase [Patescibacteria group bacterium]
MYQAYKRQFEDELKEIRESGMWKEVGVLEGKQGAEILIKNDKNDENDKSDKNKGTKLLNFCANNYLGLASSDELAQAAIEGVKKYGFGEASVRFIVGTSMIHKDLEKEISRFFGTEDAITYTSCFDANTGLFETILKEGDAIFSDELNHASIIDGVRLCKAERFRYKNSDMADLEAKLKEFRDRVGTGLDPSVNERGSKPSPTRESRLLIATDGVFSMDGITAKISQICDLAEKYGAMVMVDDSHGSGVLGEHGRGAVEGLMDRVDILTSTFGKALGGAGGGFTAGRKEIIQVLHQRSRTTLFSNSLPPMIASAALHVLQNFDSKFISLRKQLAENTSYFRSAMEKLGFALGGDGRHPITPVMLGEEKLATEMAAKLFTHGIYVRGFTYPVVPKGKARIRVQISAAHTKEQMDKAAEAFGKVGKEMGITEKRE